METRFFNRSFQIVCLGRKKVWQPLQYISLGRLSSAVQQGMRNLGHLLVFVSLYLIMLPCYILIYVYVCVCLYVHHQTYARQI